MTAIAPIDDTTRAAALALLGGDERTLRDPSLNVLVSEDGQGAATWYEDHSPVAKLGAVVTATDDRKLFYEVIREVASRMFGAGFTRGQFMVHDPRLLARIQRDFRVAPIVVGAVAGKPSVWAVEVDLQDAIAQLDAQLALLAAARAGSL
jgi:hypothetical protein